MFKSLEIKKSAQDKLQFDRGSLMKSDVEGSIKSIPPGEWILIRDTDRKRVYLGFANPLVEDRYPAIQVLTRLLTAPTSQTVEELIVERIEKSLKTRQFFDGYQKGARVIFGDSDGLPGLIVDTYLECALIQINTAGMDKWRTRILEEIEKRTNKKCYFLDHPQQRMKEVLPHYRESLPFDELAVSENDFIYTIPVKNLQKIGWYYDHRENRNKFEQALKRWNGNRSKGLDLFCYGGAWGLHMLRAGVEQVIFVDQADLDTMIENHLVKNSFSSRGKFIRDDVFKWIDTAIKNKDVFDVIVSDPPAFAKSPKEHSAAVEGYKKLHKKIFKILNPNGLVAFASCTHYVDLNEFIETIQIAARSEDKKIQILELGMQGWDHPVSSIKDKANYIKYVLVKVE